MARTKSLVATPNLVLQTDPPAQISQLGDQYYNVATNRMRQYTNTGWQDVSQGGGAGGGGLATAWWYGE